MFLQQHALTGGIADVVYIRIIRSISHGFEIVFESYQAQTISDTGGGVDDRALSGCLTFTESTSKQVDPIAGLMECGFSAASTILIKHVVQVVSSGQ